MTTIPPYPPPYMHKDIILQRDWLWDKLREAMVLLDDEDCEDDGGMPYAEYDRRLDDLRKAISEASNAKT